MMSDGACPVCGRLTMKRIPVCQIRTMSPVSSMSCDRKHSDIHCSSREKNFHEKCQ